MTFMTSACRNVRHYLGRLPVNKLSRLAGDWPLTNFVPSLGASPSCTPPERHRYCDGDNNYPSNCCYDIILCGQRSIRNFVGCTRGCP